MALAIADKVSDAGEAFGYQFRNNLLGAEALQMAGSVPIYINGSWKIVEKNDRMAVLGGSLLHSLFCQVWYKHRTTEGKFLPRGGWDTILQHLLSNENLGHVGRELSLDHCIILNPGMRSVSEKMLAESVKALFAAIYLDAGDRGYVALRDAIMHIGLHEHSLLTNGRDTLALAAL